MREIKFRAWDKRNKWMIYEDEHNSDDYWDGVCVSSVRMVNMELANTNNDYIWMQYTGLKDKNGKEIFEGDIVKRYDNEKGIVKCRDYEAQTVIEDDAGYAKHNLYIFILGGACEIIGNIYENPELLKH